MAEEKTLSVFETLYKIATDKISQKNGLNYISWAAAWAEVKKVYPHAKYTVHSQIMDDYGNTRPWFDDGKTGWVKVTAEIGEESATVTLPIMDYKNKSLSVDAITSQDANKAIQRCKVKAFADLGFGLFVYLGEDMPEEVKEIEKLQIEVTELVTKRAAISADAKKKVGELCKAAEKEFMPDSDDSEITGNPARIFDVDILKKLKRQLQAIRAVPKK